MTRARVRDLSVSLARTVGAVRQYTDKLCDDPKVPDEIVALDEALEHFEGVVYGKTCVHTRDLALERGTIPFNETDL